MAAPRDPKDQMDTSEVAAAIRSVAERIGPGVIECLNASLERYGTHNYAAMSLATTEALMGMIVVIGVITDDLATAYEVTNTDAEKNQLQLNLIACLSPLTERVTAKIVAVRAALENSESN